MTILFPAGNLPPGPPVHNHPGPPSRSAYVNGSCPHPACRHANADYQRTHKQRRARVDETWIPTVPAGPARRHLLSLLEGGAMISRVARVSGVGLTTLKEILGPPCPECGARDRAHHNAGCQRPSGGRGGGDRSRRAITLDTAARLLGVGLADVISVQVAAARTRVLLDDLASEGYSASRVAAMLGRKRILLGDTVPEPLAAQVEVLHARLLGAEPIGDVDQVGVDPEEWWPPPPDASWTARAKCRPIEGRPVLTAAFFPGRGDDQSRSAGVCAACAVRDACLGYALAHRDLQGMWGGTSLEERNRMRGSR